MTEFLNPVDIANRALQHCGALRIDATLGFTESSVNASECAFAYPKLRLAELRRNVWRFAIRRATLRPLDTNSLLLVPVLWVSTTTYFQGSIVSDQNSNLWISKVPNNLGNDPMQTGGLWEPYFGPMSVSLLDSSQSYFAGEMVYTKAGDGTFNVYLSMISGNSVHPAIPNQWATNTVFYNNDVVQTFPAWASGTTYSQGQGVSYTDGNTYVSLVSSNIGNTPSTSTAKWQLMPVLSLASQSVPITSLVQLPTSSPIAEWSYLTTYSAGAFVMFAAKTWLAIAASTNQLPSAAGSTYWVQVTNGTAYMSLMDLNSGNDPRTTTVAAWSSVTSYSIGNTVTGSNNVIYTSVTNSNLNNDPVADSGTNWSTANVLSPWTTVFTLGSGNPLWIQIGGAQFPNGVGLSVFDIVSPLSAGALTHDGPRNIFRLPSGYLRKAPRDPKAGSTSYLGAESGLPYDDWLIEGDFIVSREIEPIVFRFIADVSDVRLMDAMFCEGLAARLALEVCETITQSTTKLQIIAKAYGQFMTDARTVNAIEVGAEEPPMDDYIACRQ